MYKIRSKQKHSDGKRKPRVSTITIFMRHSLTIRESSQENKENQLGIRTDLCV